MPGLSSIELLVLGLVALMPMHGHMINQIIGSTRPELWLNTGEKHVYYVLRKLERVGDLSVRFEKPTSAPMRNVYSVTEKGRQTLAVELVRPDRLEAYDGVGFSVVIGLLPYAAWLSDEERTAVVRQRSDALEQLRVEQFSDSAHEVTRMTQGEAVTWIWERGRAHIESELAWLERIIERVETGGWNLQPPTSLPE